MHPYRFLAGLLPFRVQSVERLVKKVTEAAAHVYTQERRDGYIRGQEASAELIARNRSSWSNSGSLVFEK